VDFGDSPQEAAFRQEVRAWLEANVPSEQGLADLDEIARAKLWQKRKFDAGWACLRWPKKYGGRDASPFEQVIWNFEESRFATPRNIFAIGEGMAGPTLMSWGSEQHKERHLPKIASGEEVWCQLFSEPAGGSDLAALRTRAERDGDSWLINGQKIWVSGAHYSDYGILLARTDPTVPKHKGLSYFFLDMKSSGVEAKPIKQISGSANFNEVFFTDVRVPDEQRLGEVGQGWQVALTTLMHERAFIGRRGMAISFDTAFRLAKRVTIGGRPAIEDGAVRAKLANWYVQEAGLKFTGYRLMTALSRGETPGPENSIGKYIAAGNNQDIANFCLDLLDMSGAIWDPDLSDSAGVFQAAFMAAPGARIAGGTDEIMLNILAERVLGLPQETRIDKDIPFHLVPTAPP
jgi:alkylation response protein AidB-like acyl-CoA dehydrogenase